MSCIRAFLWLFPVECLLAFRDWGTFLTPNDKEWTKVIASDPRGFQVKKIKKPLVIHISICCFFFGLFLSLQQISGEGENGQIRSLEEREKQSKKKNKDQDSYWSWLFKHKFRPLFQVIFTSGHYNKCVADTSIASKPLAKISKN